LIARITLVSIGAQKDPDRLPLRQRGAEFRLEIATYNIVVAALSVGSRKPKRYTKIDNTYKRRVRLGGHVTY
jgi:hypothetical protein